LKIIALAGAPQYRAAVQRLIADAQDYLGAGARHHLPCVNSTLRPWS
jgi:hypothetical protein